MSEKDLVRKKIIKARKNLNGQELSRKICRKILDWDKFKKAKVVMGYFPCGSEVDVALVNRAAFKRKKLCLPAVKKGKIIPVFSSSEEILKDDYGIPYLRGPRISPRRIDMVLAPGVAFDSNGRRLGRGGGYYDRFLKKCINAIIVGVCFSAQMVEKVPAGRRDISMDYLCTEEGIFKSEE